jgi:hypothetical protein
MPSQRIPNSQSREAPSHLNPSNGSPGNRRFVAGGRPARSGLAVADAKSGIKLLIAFVTALFPVAAISLILLIVPSVEGDPDRPIQDSK